MGEAQEGGLGTQAEMYKYSFKNWNGHVIVKQPQQSLFLLIPVILRQYFVVIKSMIPHQ